MGAKLQTVFIDEGFGTLDPETLEDVVDALERLREGNLLVGVISHVPLLSQRIRAGLKVEKAGGWSTVKAAQG
jgi:exonuclease SbcC